MTKSQTPLVKAGTVLSIGTVTSIENDCVKLVFKGNTIDLFDIGISTPEDTSLAIGCINEVAFVHTASRFGTTGVLQRHHHFPVRV